MLSFSLLGDNILLNATVYFYFTLFIVSIGNPPVQAVSQTTPVLHSTNHGWVVCHSTKIFIICSSVRRASCVKPFLIVINHWISWYACICSFAIFVYMRIISCMSAPCCWKSCLILFRCHTCTLGWIVAGEVLAMVTTSWDYICIMRIFLWQTKALSVSTILLLGVTNGCFRFFPAHSMDDGRLIYYGSLYLTQTICL